MKLLFDEHTRMLLYSIICFGVGVTMYFIIGRRRFYRRGMAGLQQFKNYRTAVLTIIVERLLNVLALLLIGLSIILFLMR